MTVLCGSKNEEAERFPKSISDTFLLAGKMKSRKENFGGRLFTHGCAGCGVWQTGID